MLEGRISRAVFALGNDLVNVSEFITDPTPAELAEFLPFQPGDYYRKITTPKSVLLVRAVTRDRTQIPQGLLAEIRPE